MNDNIRVLIVDDEERFRETTAAILRKRGFDVTAVASGIEAIEAIKKDHIDVVVLDFKMPGMTGNEALAEIKKLKPDVAAIMLTGHGAADAAREGLREGLFDYLIKPCAIDFLAQKIREAYAQGAGLTEKEPRVKQAMVPLSSFRSIRQDQTVAKAVKTLLEGFSGPLTTSTVQETIHRSILVTDDDDRIVGIITFTDLLHGLQPSYMRLLVDKPQLADTIHVESPTCSGMFTIMARDLATKTVREIMSDTPPFVNANANLMEAATKLLDTGFRRLLVTDHGQIVGVIREQDLFFEMANIIRQYDASHER